MTWTAANAAELIAHVQEASTLSGADTIILSPGATYTLTAATDPADGGNGLAWCTDSAGLTIVGNGATIQCSPAKGTVPFRIFDVAAGASLKLENLTLQGGVATQGGAVFNQGTLTMTTVIVQGNTAQGYPGGYGWGTSFPGGDAAGGGIYSTGELVMAGCTVQNNTALGGRGINGGTYTAHSIDYPTTYKVWAPGSNGGNAYGGGVYVGGGTATITATVITTNTAKGGMGGSKGGSDGYGYGGGIAGTVFLDPFTRDHLKRNTASTSGNDISGSYSLA
jgi:hypothetical protein